MGRPQKVIQRKPNGIYFVQLWLDGKRVTKSLETKDAVKATARASQAIRELQEAFEKRGQQRWEADTPTTAWDIPSNPDGSNNYSAAVEKVVAWSEIAEPEQIKLLNWNDLVREAVRVRKSKEGRDFSKGWYDNAKFAINRVPFTLQEATPAAIRKWIVIMEKEGLHPRTVEINCATLASLIQKCMKSGLLTDIQVNPFSLVDYRTNQSTPIPTATEEDYKGFKELIPRLKQNQRLLLLLQIFTGTRISEYRRRGAEAFDLSISHKATVFFDGHQEGRVKNKTSERTIPIPEFLADELRDFDFQWPSLDIINKKIKMVNPELSSHSFRHGLVRLGRDLQVEADVLEAYVGHKLPGMKDVYGDGYAVDTFREVIQPIWNQLYEWVEP